MKTEINSEDTKPNDWPANAIEAQLENIYNQLEKFKENPNYFNKEVLISLTTYYDLNQRSSLGLLRTSDYEVSIINSLYLHACMFNMHSLKTYIYELIGEKTVSHKLFSHINKNTSTQMIDAFVNLVPHLKLYHLTYLYYSIDKDKPFSDKLIETIVDVIEYERNNRSSDLFYEVVADFANYLLTIVNDISNFNCKNRTGEWAFSRDEIFRLFNLIAKLFKEYGESPFKRPVKGVLMTSISNYILKSRNEYNEGYICKYVSEDVASKSIINKEIWMLDIKKLNDTREQKVIPEIFLDESWNSYIWAKDIDFTPNRKYFVSCFSKSINDDSLKEKYGSCVYGYKNDRISELISPIHFLNFKTRKVPFLSQVLAFDVIYDLEQAKEEIQFLCKLIDCFEMNEIEKKEFLEEILQYWILSVKDEEWSQEHERRYVIFLYDDYEYLEIDKSEDNYLKVKTTLFDYPDFVLGNNPSKFNLKMNIENKSKSISMKSYVFCEDCLSLDFDMAIGVLEKDYDCPICNSKKLKFVKV